MKIFPLSLILCFIFFIFVQNTSYAQNCTSAEECQTRIKEYESKLSEIKTQKNTLTSQLALMDTQISITTIKINNTELTIKKLEEEINELGEKIDLLNSSLTYLSKILLQKIIESYKTRNISPLEIFLDSQHATSFINKLKYMQATTQNDHFLALKLQKSKYSFEEQKSLQQEKKKELESLKKTLHEQQINLENQKKQKQILLAQTNNNEQTYQQLLAAAQRQLASFKSFVQNAGAGKIGPNEFGNGSDGNYFSQRDARWADQKIGYSNEIILEVGCLITDIAMTMKKYGVDMTPATIASNPQYFFANTAYMLKPSQFSWPNGLQYKNISKSEIGSKVDAGKYVIVGVYAGKYGTHYVTIIKRDNDSFIMHDPYYGPDKKFSDYYSFESIFTAGLFE